MRVEGTEPWRKERRRRGGSPFSDRKPASAPGAGRGRPLPLTQSTSSSSGAVTLRPLHTLLQPLVLLSGPTGGTGSLPLPAGAVNISLGCEAIRECSGGLWCPRPRTPLGNPPPDKLQTDGRGEGMHGGRPLVYWFSSIYPNPRFSLVLSLLGRCGEANVSIHLFYPVQDTALGGEKPSVLQITVFLQTAGWIYAFN